MKKSKIVEVIVIIPKERKESNTTGKQIIEIKIIKEKTNAKIKEIIIISKELNKDKPKSVKKNKGKNDSCIKQYFF